MSTKKIIKNGKVIGRINEQTLKIEEFEDTPPEFDKDVVDGLKSEYAALKAKLAEIPDDNKKAEATAAIEKELEAVEQKIISHMKEKNPDMPEDQIHSFVDKMIEECKK